MYYRSLAHGLLYLVQTGGHLKALFITSFQSFFQKFNLSLTECLPVCLHIVADKFMKNKLYDEIRKGR
ncbi:hypothetical protein SAMN03159284_00358 [Mucilaginibacter sp. NFR10]|nr:hypothetical protein SAMN03159284_00358 [Mucilaginibacter sp. NFR10]